MSSGATSKVNGDRSRTGLERASSILQDRFPELHLSTRRLRQSESLQLVRDRRNEANQHLGFASRPFVLCALPVRCPPRSTLVYERRNGLFTLQITGHPDFGLPFGQDRLVPIFLATLAVRQQSQTIRFRSAAQMLDIFGMAKGGKEYRRLVAAFERIFGATIFFGTESTRKHARIIQRSRFNLLREAQIWYNRDPAQEVLSAEFENVIVLSDEFYNEVIAHPIPADIEAVKAFGSGRSPSLPSPPAIGRKSCSLDSLTPSHMKRKDAGTIDSRWRAWSDEDFRVPPIRTLCVRNCEMPQHRGRLLACRQALEHLRFSTLRP